MQKRVFDPSLPNCFLAASTSFSNSFTAYSRVVRLSSTSSTIRTFFPTRFDISNELRSNHCVRVTLVPGSSTGPSVLRFSYRDRPIAWIGMFGLPGRFKNDLNIAQQTLAAVRPRAHVPQNASGYVSSPADGNHQIGLEVIQDPLGGGLT